MFDGRTNRFDGVSILEDRMPLRNHAPCLGKEKKEDSVNDNQRFVKRMRCVDAPRPTPHEGFDEVFESAVDAVLQRCPEQCPVFLREFDGAIEQRSRPHALRVHRRGTQQPPEQAERTLVVNRSIE